MPETVEPVKRARPTDAYLVELLGKALFRVEGDARQGGWYGERARQEADELRQAWQDLRANQEGA